MAVKEYVIQLYGFVVKVFLQRWRSPITSLVEILLPFLFAMLLSLCYWTTDSTIEPSQIYDGIAHPIMNYSQLGSHFWCLPPGSSIRTGTIPACNMTAAVPGNLGPLMYNLPDFYDGKQVAMYSSYVGSSAGLRSSLFFISGPLSVFGLDWYIIWSWFVTQNSRDENPTFLGRTSRSSISHYGELLIASDDRGLGEDFMAYLRSQSGLVDSILNTNVYPTWDAAHDYAKDHPDRIWAIVELPSAMMTATEETDYTISMNFTATPWTFRQNTRSLFSRKTVSGDGYVLYLNSGFATLQTLVNNFFTKAKADAGVAQVGPGNMVGIAAFLNNFGTGALPMPTPPAYANAFMVEWQYYVPLVAMMAAIFPVARLTAMIVEEKPAGIRESMLIMGMHRSCMFGGWYLPSIVLDFVASLLAAMVLKLGFLSYVNYGILLVLYFSFLQQNTALALCISTIFSNPRIASWCAAFLIFIFAIPAYNFPNGMSDIAKVFLSLLPCIGFTMSFFDMTEYSSYGWSFTWSVAREGGFNVAIAIGMMWASWGILMLLAFYLDRVWPGTVGRPDVWWFPIRPLIRCFSSSKQPKPVPMTQNTASRRRDLYTGYPISEEKEEVENNRAVSDREPISSTDSIKKHEAGRCPRRGGGSADNSSTAMIEHADEVVDPCNEGVAAIFDNIYKIYYGGGVVGWVYTFFTGLFRSGDRTVALDGVTFAMRKGEVSVLLGPNGAGKSTLMGVATGMVRPSSGEVYISGYAASQDLDKCRRHIGYCPQQDIVWDDLTVSEHVTFYARLKGCDSICVGSHADKAIDLVGLEGKTHCKAGNLSGGQRRRLCVAIALVCDSSVLLLDEPTSGMDIQGRKIVYEALNRARANRSVLLCTHLLDEADRIGDRILIVSGGKLRGEGSSMHLKSQMKVGYVMTCVLDSSLDPIEEDHAVNDLIEFVKEKGYDRHRAEPDAVVAVPAGCPMLGVERRGREISFRFPISFLSDADGGSMLGALQKSTDALRLRSVGLNLTSLEDVFMSATTGAREAAASAADAEALCDAQMRHSGPDDVTYASSNGCAVFCRHFRALFIKRMNFARRDMMLLVFQVVIPVLFLCLSLIINLIRAPSQPALTLDMATVYPDSASDPAEVFSSEVTTPMWMMFTPAYRTLRFDSFGLGETLPEDAMGPGLTFSNVPVTSADLNGTWTLTEMLASEAAAHEAPRVFAFAPANFAYQSGPPVISSLIMHNISDTHALPIGLSALYNLARYQVFGTAVPRLQVRNRPMPIGEFEKELFGANKQVMAGIFVILPFVLIPCNTISYIVREKECGARHMQWLSGASVAAYWLSCFIFDFCCYLGTLCLSLVIFVIFNRKEYILGPNIGVTVTLFVFFGLSAVMSSYLLSFFFKSAFTAQTVVLLVNFVFGFLWVTLEEMLAMGAYKFVYWTTAVLRVIPAVSFAEGLYVLAGQRIGDMLFPLREKDSMYSLLTLTSKPEFLGGIGSAMIYMGSVTVGCVIALIILEYVRVQRAVAGFGACCADDAYELDDVIVANRDPSVLDEEVRVCGERRGPAGDMIALQHVTKHYFGSKHAACADVSLGVREGEVMGLLGLNGAGKSTALGVIAGESMATSGEAFVNRISVTDASSRSFIGYCPQYNPLLDLLSPKEHLWLYARLRGMREELIREEVLLLIRALGLYPHRDKAAIELSGGNKRRLSLAISLVGRTTSVLLDEPTAGMDTLARSQTCAVVKQLTANKSVILTTHLLDEVEAMADRVTFMTRGRVTCVGTPAELRARGDSDAAYTITVNFAQGLELPGTRIPRRIEKYAQKVIRRMTECEASRSGGGAEAGGKELGKDVEDEDDEDDDDWELDEAAKADGNHRESAYPGAGERDGNSNSGEFWAELGQVNVSSLRLTVHAPLTHICRVMADLRGGKIRNVPAVAYVSVAQPTLEDILLEGESKD